MTFPDPASCSDSRFVRCLIKRIKVLASSGFGCDGVYPTGMACRVRHAGEEHPNGTYQGNTADDPESVSNNIVEAKFTGDRQALRRLNCSGKGEQTNEAPRRAKTLVCDRDQEYENEER